MTLAARRAVAVYQRDGFLDEILRQFFRVADGGGGEDELRMRAVERGNAFQAADHVGDVRAEDAAVGVQLVNDDEF
ncbi:MAG: hypothetical protein PGMFKBFP_01230 [Anaerolineales bacterium]|nr:hypothetical protein [Anaerolineales bacterium]